MILDAFHTGQNAAVWTIAFLAGYLAMLTPIAATAILLRSTHLPRRLRARIIEHRHRPTRHRS